jgi:hypothetical protein
MPINAVIMLTIVLALVAVLGIALAWPERKAQNRRFTTNVAKPRRRAF